MNTYTKLKSGEWGIRVQGSARVGERVEVTKKSGESKFVRSEHMIFYAKSGENLDPSEAGRWATRADYEALAAELAAANERAEKLEAELARVRRASKRLYDDAELNGGNVDLDLLRALGEALAATVRSEIGR